MKKAAPIIITLIMAIYLSGYAYVLLFITKGMGLGRVVLGIAGLVVLGVLVALLYTLKERLKEIDKEDDDDLSKY